MKAFLADAQIGPVQDGIPVPARPGGKPGVERQALEELDPGQSRVFSGIDSRKLIQTAASIRKADPTKRYSVRSIGATVRVWRLA
jgi:hypothetical protein